MGDLVKILQVSQPTASRHLAYLRRAALVLARKTGLWNFYTLAPANTSFHRNLLKCLRSCFHDVPELEADEVRAAALRQQTTRAAGNATWKEEARMSKPRVLFLCTANSCRSQMAEGFLRHLAGDLFEVESAGGEPTRLSPDAIQVMKEIGIDISRQRSKDVWEFRGQGFNFVITVCDKAKEACPIFPGALTSLHWSLDDPAAAEGTESQRLVVFRRVRDQIEEHVREFIAKKP